MQNDENSVQTIQEMLLKEQEPVDLIDHICEGYDKSCNVQGTVHTYRCGSLNDSFKSVAFDVESSLLCIHITMSVLLN